MNSPKKLQYSFGYSGRLKTLLRLITSRSFLHRSAMRRWPYSKKLPVFVDPKFENSLLIVSRILAVRSWESLHTPKELNSTNLIIFFATSISLTIAHLQKKKKKRVSFNIKSTVDYFKNYCIYNKMKLLTQCENQRDQCISIM